MSIPVVKNDRVIIELEPNLYYNGSCFESCCITSTLSNAVDLTLIARKELWPQLLQNAKRAFPRAILAHLKVSTSYEIIPL